MKPRLPLLIRLAREFQELWPFWAIALAISTFNAWCFFDRRVGDGMIMLLSTVPYYVIFSMICVAPFGTEFSRSTAHMLLVHPVRRTRIWLEKTGIAALVLATIVPLACIVGHWHWSRLAMVHQWDEATRNRLWDNMVSPPLILAALTICIAPLFSSISRASFTAFWLTLLAPVASMMLVVALDFGILKPTFGFTIHQTLFNNKITPYIIIWCLVCAPLGWWKFVRLEV